MVTLAPAHPGGRKRDAAAARARQAASVRTSAPRRAWWQWLDFDSKVLAQVWLISCVQIVVLVVGGLVIHASSASPY